MVSEEFWGNMFPDGIYGNTKDSISLKDCVSTTADVSINETSVSNDSKAVEALSSIPEREATMDGDMEVFINSVLEQTYAKLAISSNINDVAEAFKAIDECLIKAEYAIAIMISYIQEEKLWQRYGYSSMDKFLDDLPDVCKVSRQTFTNAANAGKVIRYLSSPFVEASLQLKFKLTQAVFYRNFSKMQFLYRLVFVWRMPLTNEVFVNFLNMTHRDFESFMKDYGVKNQSVIARIGKITQKSSKKTAQTNKPKPQPIGVPELNEVETAICHESRLGRVIGFLASSNPLCVESVKKHLHERRIQVYNEKWRGFLPLSKIRYKDQPDVCLNEMDWSELLPDNFGGSVSRLSSLLETGLAPCEVKEAFAKAFKTKTELILVQAHIIHRMENVPELLQSVKDYLLHHQMDNQNKNPVMSFAFYVFGIESPRFKMLKRIGSGLCHLADMCRDPDIKGKVRYTSEGFLEKLSYLATAKKNHAPNYRLIADALNTVSAKRFRKFANNRGDDLTNDPVTLKDYQAAKSNIDKLQIFLSRQGFLGRTQSVSIIGLQSEAEREWLNNINRSLEIGEEHLKKWYPDIVWDSQFQVEYVSENNSESEEAKLVLIPSEQTFGGDLNSSITSHSTEAVAA